MSESSEDSIPISYIKQEGGGAHGEAENSVLQNEFYLCQCFGSSDMSVQ